MHLACISTHGAWFPRAAAPAATVAEFPLRTFRKPAAAAQIWALAQWFREHRIAVVHTTEINSNIFGLAGAALAGVPVRVANRRELNPGKRAVHIAMQRAAYSLAHTVVANSLAAAQQLAAERVPARKIAVVFNGLDCDAVGAHRASDRPRAVIAVANLRPEKGHDVLIDAAAHVLRQIPNATFDIVGDGPELPNLVARAGARGVLHAVRFLGHRDDVAERLAAADIFVLPSRSEAFPNAVLEAMAAGLPIVTSAVGGMLELIDDGRTGLLTPCGDAPALADRLIRLMREPELAAQLGEAARADARARFAFDRMVGGFERIYLTQLTRRGVLATQHPQLAAS